jgi:murein DD-endopeptidase MepM/ murein hydrolase activator NlpD
VGRCQTGLLLMAGLFLFMLLSAGFGYLMLFKFGGVQVPAVQKILVSALESEGAKERLATQQRLSAMAIKVGEMQAQILRLEALGERVAKVSGIKKEEINFDRKPGRGGPLLPGLPGAYASISLDEFQQELLNLGRALDDKTDQMAVMEAMLSREQVRRAALPSALPVNVGFYSSNFGWRLDPFTGQRAMHEGVDFVAEHGTAIKAAAGGIVAYSDIHAGYGNMIEVDHGNGLVSRYAHASKRLVKEGDVVLRGQKIGEVGSTGRSTGPHLHFEVLLNGTPQNPTRYLNLPG